MRIFFLIPLVVASAHVAGAEVSDNKAVPAKVTLAEAEQLVRDYVFQVKPKMNPAVRFPLKEVQVDGLFDKLGYQMFKVTDDVWAFESLLVGHGRVQPLGEGFGGWGVMSVCLADLDGDGKEELVYSYSWGSGIHRSHVAAAKPTADGRLQETKVPFAFQGDLFVRKLENGTVRVEAGEFGKKVNEWTVKATLGILKASAKDGELQLGVALAESLAKDVREAIWK